MSKSLFKKKDKDKNKNKNATLSSPTSPPTEPKIKCFISEIIDEKTPIPEDDIIESKMNMLLFDLDIYGKQRQPLESKSVKDKWDFIIKQNIVDRQRQAPDVFLDDLRNKVSRSTLDTINSYLSQYRLSWGIQFCRLDGHLVLLNILSGIQGHLEGFVQMPPDESSQLLATLLCIRSICNSKSGFPKITKHKNSLRIIINSLSLDEPRTFDTVFEITMLFIFAKEDLEKQTKILTRIIKYFNELQRKKMVKEKEVFLNGWEAIASNLHNNPSHTFLNSLSGFLTGILEVLKHGENAKLLVDWSKDVESSGLLAALKECGQQKQNILEIAGFIDDTLKFTYSIYPKASFNFFDIDNVVQQLATKDESKYLIYNVLLSLFDISYKYEQVYNKLIVYIFNVVNLIRVYGANGNSDQYQQAFDFSRDLKHMIKIKIDENTLSDNPNHFLVQLSKSKFYFEKQLSKLQVMDLVFDASSKKITQFLDDDKPAVNAEEVLKSADSSRFQEVIADYQRKLRDSQIQIEGLKDSYKSATAEVEALKQKLASPQSDNSSTERTVSAADDSSKINQLEQMIKEKDQKIIQQQTQIDQLQQQLQKDRKSVV